MRLISLVFLVLIASFVFYFEDGLGSDFFQNWDKQKPVRKKISAVKPKFLVNKAEDLKPVSPQFTFFETLEDKTLTKYVGLHGEVLPLSLPDKPIIFKEKKPVKINIQPNVTRPVEEKIKIQKKPEVKVSKFALQVSSFRDEKKAGLLKTDLQKKGFDAFLRVAELPNHGGKWYRVFLGQYSDQDLARKDSERARREHKLNSVIIRRSIE